jgi:putative transcriptional regulator
MNEKMFNELLESVREGAAILRREKESSRRFTIDAAGVQAIRERTSLSQSEFAQLIGVALPGARGSDG